MKGSSEVSVFWVSFCLNIFFFKWSLDFHHHDYNYSLCSGRCLLQLLSFSDSHSSGSSAPPWPDQKVVHLDSPPPCLRDTIFGSPPPRSSEVSSPFPLSPLLLPTVLLMLCCYRPSFLRPVSVLKPAFILVAAWVEAIPVLQGGEFVHRFLDS